MNEKPICMQCKHRMAVKMTIIGQAQENRGNGVVKLIGPVRQEVINSACKLAMVPVCANPCVTECSEFTPTVIEPKLRMPASPQDAVTV